MPEKNKKSKKRLFYKLRDNFTTGLLVLAPSAVTIWILLKVFRWFDNILGKWYTRLFDYLGFEITHFPGLGAITLAILITLIGYLTRHYIGKKALELWESIIHRVPLIRKIYSSVRQVSDSLARNEALFFQRPVLVEYPRHGIYSIGFVTREFTGLFRNAPDKKFNIIFIPTTPNPTSGLVIVLPYEECIPIDMSVEDAMKAIISAGIVFPESPLMIP